MDQADAAAKKLVLDSSDVLYDSVLKHQRTPLPAEIPNPDKPSRFGLNRSEPVDFSKGWLTGRSTDAPKLAIEVSPGTHLGITFESSATTKSLDPRQELLGEQTRAKNTLFGGAGIYVQKRF
jgi:hypothetical protein